MKAFDYSIYKNKLWDSQIVSYLSKIYEYKGKQELFVRTKPQELERLVEIAKIQSIESSNKIEGIVTTASRIKELCAEKTTPKNRNEEEIAGYRKVLNTIHESYEFIPLRSSIILQLHRDLYSESEKSFGGKFKNSQNYIIEKLEDGTEKIRFKPLDAVETPQAIESICENMQKALDEEICDPLILIPIFINDFLCIHPFNDGNGRMSRLLTSLLLYKCGFSVGKYISVEKKIEETKEKYYEALESVSENWYSEENDTTPFIKYMLGVILSCYRDFEERIFICDKSSSAYDIVKKAVETKLGKITKSELFENCPNISKSSIELALKTLCQENFLEKKGGGRSTFYVLK